MQMILACEAHRVSIFFAMHAALRTSFFVETWRADAERAADRAQTPVIAIAENAGLVIEDNSWAPFGSGSVTILIPMGNV